MAQALQILVVDDQPGARECFCELMRELGHHATSVGSPEAALEELERARFDLLVVDYDLDDLVTGTLLIQEARRRKLLDGSRVILLTGHEEPNLPAGVELVQKPFETSALIARINELAQARVDGAPLANGSQALVRFVLYVRSRHSGSWRTLALLNEAIGRFAPGTVELDVRDLSSRENVIVEHDVAITPAVVKVRPAPEAWLLGELESAEPLIALIESAGATQLPRTPARPRSNRPPL